MHTRELPNVKAGLPSLSGRSKYCLLGSHVLDTKYFRRTILLSLSSPFPLARYKSVEFLPYRKKYIKNYLCRLQGQDEKEDEDNEKLVLCLKKIGKNIIEEKM